MTRESRENVTLRIVLYKGEVCRLPRDNRGIAVSEGIAWITREGEDRVLSAGESATFCGGKWATIVSAVAGPAVIEVMGVEHPRSPAISRAARYQSIVGGNPA